jgi:hypothetical protein
MNPPTASVSLKTLLGKEKEPEIESAPATEVEMRQATTNEADTRSVVQPTLCPSLNSRIPPTATLQAQACTTPTITQDSASGETRKADSNG